MDLLNLVYEPYCYTKIPTSSSILIKIERELTKSYRREVIHLLVIFRKSLKSTQSEFRIKRYRDCTGTIVGVSWLTLTSRLILTRIMCELEKYYKKIIYLRTIFLMSPSLAQSEFKIKSY